MLDTVESIETGDVGDNTEVTTAAPQQPTRELPQIDEIELRIDGKIVRMSREKAIALAQKGASSDRKFAEAAKAKQEAEELLSTAQQKDFLKLAQKAGMSLADAREALEKTLLSMYEQEAMSPEERELKELRELKAQQEAQAKAAKEKAEQEQLSKEEEKYLANLENDLVEALEKSVLPPLPIMAKLAANYLSAALANDIDLTPAEAVKLVEQDQLTLIKQMVGSVSPDKLEALLGAKTIKTIRDQGVKSVKDMEAKLKPATKAPLVSQPARQSDSKPVRSDNFFEQLRRKNGII